MLRRHPAPPQGPALPEGAQSLPAGGAIAQNPGRPRSLLQDKLRAASWHLGLSAVLAVMVLAVVTGGWYPAPLPTIVGVGSILVLMLWVDVLLGPLATFVVFDRRKPRLWLDLTLIGLVQLGALAYGVYTVERGRPAFIVLAKDRFEVVAPSELKSADLAAAAANPAAQRAVLRPQWVSARQPELASERIEIALEAAGLGRDVQHYPRLYVDYTVDAAEALQRALPLARLRQLNPEAGAQIDRAVAATGQPEAALRYLPIRGPAQDGVVWLEAKSGHVLGMALFKPW